MRCPECKHDTFKPVYAETISPYLDDRPFTYNHEKPPHKELSRLICTHCQAYYMAFAGETAQQAYTRILHDFAHE